MSLDEYIKKNYQNLIRYARNYTRDPKDLISHTYIKMIDAGFVYINEPMTDWYFKRSMKNNAIRGEFHDQYTIRSEELGEIEQTHDMEKIIQREQVDAILRRLSWFDRTIFELYLGGQNMTQLSEESGISLSTIYHRIKKVRTILKNNL